MTPTVAMVYSIVICKSSAVALSSSSGYRTPAGTWLGNRAPHTQGLRLYRSSVLVSMQEWHAFKGEFCKTHAYETCKACAV
jgi:hypothetical protein